MSDRLSESMLLPAGVQHPTRVRLLLSFALNARGEPRGNEIASKLGIYLGIYHHIFRLTITDGPDSRSYPRFFILFPIRSMMHKAPPLTIQW